jgi:N-acetylneuraminic acid mutarotase
MTTDGNYNVNNVNSVNIPSIVRSINTPIIGANSGGSRQPQHYVYKNDFYSLRWSTNVIVKAKINDILNGVAIPNVQPSGDEFLTDIYPSPLDDDYFYNYGATDNAGTSLGGTIYKAHIDSPDSWIFTGNSVPAGAIYSMKYYDGSTMYLIGGVISGTPTDVISTGSGLTFTTSGNVLPAARAGGALVTVGSTIYMYGGTADGITELDTIWSASTSDPTTWTDTGITMPAAVKNAVAYTDGINVYVYGGDDGSQGLNTIYVAPVGSPTSLVLSGNTLPWGVIMPNYMNIHVTDEYIYLIHNNGAVYRASTSSPEIFTVVTSTLATAVRSSHVAIHDGYVYAFGGFTTGNTMSTVIQTAPISNPTSWTNHPSVLPIVMGGGEIIKTNTSFYLIGAGANDTVNYTPFCYKSDLTDPTTFDVQIVDGGGPARTRGRAAVIGDHIWYFGGEDPISSTSSLTTVTRGTIDRGTGLVTTWMNDTASYFISALPVALSRFALVVAGDYIYIIGGCNRNLLSTSMNTDIYRCQINAVGGFNGLSKWTSVGTITNPMTDASVVIVNNYVYIIGGCTTTTSSFTTSDDYILSASMTDLANGKASFTEENTAITNSSSAITFAESTPIIINDEVYFIGGRVTTNSTTTIYRSCFSAKHTLIAPKVPENYHSLPTVDMNSGALGSLSSHQRLGMLPWLVYK